MERALFVAQRLSGALLALLILVHLATILYASSGGLTGAEILARTRGDAGWAAFYAVFVVAASLHAPIGVRNVLAEWTRWPAAAVNALSLVVAAVLLITGSVAVAAVFGR